MTRDTRRPGTPSRSRRRRRGGSETRPDHAALAFGPVAGMVRGPDPGLIYHNLLGSGCCYHEPRARRGRRPMTRGTELGRPIEILLVEDNPGDIDLAREGLADGKIRNKLHVVGDGEEAMAFLRGRGSMPTYPCPTSSSLT